MSPLAANSNPPIKPPLIACDGLSASYNGRPAIVDVGFRANGGERIAVLGPNGGGKTTLFRVLLGELRPAAGDLLLGGRCAWVPQTDRSRLDYPVSALDVALMGSLAQLPWWRPPGRRERMVAREALERVGLGELSDETFGELSGGQRQRVLIARALAQDARLLLLDEPFTGLDAGAARVLLALIDELAGAGRAVLIATHDLDQARSWDLVLCLNRDQIAFGHPSDALTRDVLERTYGGAIVEVPRPSARAGEAEVVLGLLPPHHHHHEEGER